MSRSFKYFSLAILAMLVVVVGFAASQNPSAEWMKSKHANRDLAVLEATVENRGDTAAHCARCHSEQGFKIYAAQLLKGDIGFIKGPDGKNATQDYMKSIGLTKDLVQPVTCSACHGDGFALRITNNIPMLPAGFGVSGVGKGALCMACHNTRNGRIQWDTADPKRYSQPHEAAQTDVIMGKNSFYYNDTGDLQSPHAVFTGNACVACHKEQSKEGHTFKPGECAGCHGEKIKEEFVQNGTKDLLKQLAVGVEKKVLAVKEKIACVTSWDEKTDADTPNTAIDGKAIKAVEIPMGIHGQISLKFIMQDGKAVFSQIGNVKDTCGDAGKPIFATADPVVRALWNYLLFWYDGSYGVHNPSFTRNVLQTTIDAIK